MSADPIKTLIYPFDANLLACPTVSSRLLILNAHPSPTLANWQPHQPALQTFHKPTSNALAAAGFKSSPSLPGDKPFDLVLTAIPRQHEEAMALLATALQNLKPGGLLVAAAANDAGGKRLERDFAALGLPHASAAKYKSRIVWTTQPEAADPAQLAAARAAGDVQPVPGTALTACPGLFSWDRVDPGSKLLADCLPVLDGVGADFGCGYGVLAAHVLAQSKTAALTCIDADWRAIESCRRTLGPRADTLWADIADPAEPVPQNLDWIVSNPPFHAGGKAALPALGQAFIARTAQCLKPRGELWLVANAHLPYEAALKNLFARVEKLREDGGYKIYRARK